MLPASVVLVLLSQGMAWGVCLALCRAGVRWTFLMVFPRFSMVFGGL